MKTLTFFFITSASLISYFAILFLPYDAMLIIHYLRPMARAIKNKREAILRADIDFEQMNTITNSKFQKYRLSGVRFKKNPLF